MHHKRSLNKVTVFFVFVVLLLSGLLTGFFLFILHKLQLLIGLSRTPLLLPFVTILVCVLLGTAISGIVSRWFLKPINQLIDATKQVAKGDFSVRVDSSSVVCDLQELVHSFNLMAEELGSIELFKKDFINTFSHEFKTPIVSIRGFARQLKKGNLTPQQRCEYTDIILSEAERLANMSSNILLLTKFENQQIITDRSCFQLDEQLRNCILLLEKQWGQKGISLNLELSPTPFYGNEEMLSHVWVNLLSNAIKFSPAESEIRISCHIDSLREEVHVEIADQGIGMDQETLNHIFENFYQGDTSHSSEGNGLGLPLVKRIVELCGGYVTVTSELGKGTSFSVSLPILAGGS